MSDESHVTSLGTDEQSQARPQAGSEKAPVLCRETILPRERNRGMTGVAIVCSMAGVASGLALAATLMAVQISDRPEQVRTSCWRRAQAVEVVESRASLGWLGIEFVGRHDGAYVRRVFPGTAAEAAGLWPGDIIRAFDGERLDHPSEIQHLIRRAGAGAQPTLTVERQDTQFEVRPMLTSMPSVLRR